VRSQPQFQRPFAYPFLPFGRLEVALELPSECFGGVDDGDGRGAVAVESKDFTIDAS
jgi:hypothetical protein